MTDDLPNRLKQHNAGYSFHTAKYKPWKPVNYFAFSGRHAAAEFEQYLKLGLAKHLQINTFGNKRIAPCEGIRRAPPYHPSRIQTKVSNRHDIAQKYAGFLGK